MELNNSLNNLNCINFEDSKVKGSTIKPYPLVGEMNVNDSPRCVKQKSALTDSLNLNEIFKYAEDHVESSTSTEEEPASDTPSLDDIFQSIEDGLEEPVFVEENLVDTTDIQEETVSDFETVEQLKDEGFSLKQIGNSLKFIKEIQKNIKFKKDEISKITSENNDLANEAQELKKKVGIKIVNIKVGNFVNKLFGKNIQPTNPENETLIAYEQMEKCKEQIASNKKRIKSLGKLVSQLEEERLSFADQMKKEQFPAVSLGGIGEESSIQSFENIKKPAREFKEIEKTFVGKMEFLREIIKATKPKNHDAMLKELDNVILASEAFLKRLGVGTRQQKILKALDPQELSVLFGHFCSYAEKNFISQASLKGFDLKAVLKHLQNPNLKLPDRVNRPTNEQGALSLLQSLMIEPYQKGARYLLTFNELNKNVIECGNNDPTLTSFVKAIQEVAQPLELLTAVFNLCCP